MSSALNLIDLASEIEKSLIQVYDNLLYIFSFNQDGKLDLQSKFQDQELDHRIIGGLIAAIDGFAGSPDKKAIRLVAMAEVRFFFTKIDDILLVFTFDPKNDDNKYYKFVENFASGLEFSYSFEKGYGSFNDEENICTAILKLYQLLSEEFQPTHSPGPEVSIDLESMEFHASRRLQETLRETMDSFATELIDSVETSSDNFDPENPETTMTDQADMLNDALISLENLLDRFVNKFNDIKGLAIIRKDNIGGIETIERGDLSSEVFNRLLSIILENQEFLYTLLNSDVEDRLLEVEEYFMYLEKISESSFMYVISTSKQSINLVSPIIERIANSILSIFPEDLDS
jgi:predicted regulator of Ras-like GTPase activity (Roadblock/LC7/MglB family)